MKFVKIPVFLFISLVFAAFLSVQGMQKAPISSDAYDIILTNNTNQELWVHLKDNFKHIIAREILLRPSESYTANGIPIMLGLRMSVADDKDYFFLLNNKLTNTPPTMDLVIDKNNFGSWLLSSRGDQPSKRLAIFLYKADKKNQINLFSSTTEAFKKVSFQAPAAVQPQAAAPGLEKLLNITSDPLRKEIFDLAKAKNWQGINKLIAGIQDFTMIKSLIAFQLDIALLLANQIKFDARESATTELKLPESETLKKLAEKSVLEKRKIKWLYTFLKNKKELAHVSSLLSMDPYLMRQIHIFLEELGSLSKFVPINTLYDLKNALASNFKELFEQLFMVMAVQPKILPRLEQVKKELAIQ